ncbi:lycopene cyclase domain-containing protein [Owenweeksia hongkongensis]|uniref:lycopene cyclase domain-containing protein n=1 Tax=Owenweeksia hongkongensis TaxID=253245 RepID=UPI003A9164A3
METSYLYLYLMAASFAGPFFLSFDKKVAFYKSFGSLFKSIIPVAIVFLVWDAVFTSFGFWGFNPKYISGISLFGLPLGEYLFFIVIPFCCVFVYEVLNSYISQDILGSWSTSISNFLMGFSASLAVIFYDKWYTVLTFGLLAVLVYWHSKKNKTEWLGRFYLSYAIIALPFLAINGILTGTGLDEEVVWYNDAENIGKRIFTIPIEDFFYGMLLILAVVSMFEYFRKVERENGPEYKISRDEF